MIIIGYIIFIFLILRFLVVVVNWLSNPFLNVVEKNTEEPFISILIPARNEANNLPKLFSDLKKLDDRNFEVIVCNDHSSDETENVIIEAQNQFQSLQYFNNKNLPEGWIGKNFACNQLAKRAKGDYFLFLDADVRIKSNLLGASIAYMQKHRLKLLSLFPKQYIESSGEWKTVPLMNWILLTFLPLILVRWKWFPSLSAANGQFMLFEAENYRQNLWHKKVKQYNVDDILIAKLMKKEKHKIAVLLGRNEVACRMYKSYDAAIRGFSLNIHQYFNGSRLWLILFWLLFCFRLPYFVFSAQYVLLGISIILLIAMKLIYSKLSGFNLKQNFVFHLSQIIALSQIVSKNLMNKQKRKIEWKGRVYSQ